MAPQRALRVLIIDHYDSYTNNLLQLLPTTTRKEKFEAVSTWNPAIIGHSDLYTNNFLQVLPTTHEEKFEEVSTWDPVIIKFDDYNWEDFHSSILPQFDAVILSPGPGRPDKGADFGFNSRLIKNADIPILGICLGHQGIATSHGARVMHAPNIKHGQVSLIEHDGSGLFVGLPPGFDGVQYNSLVVNPDTLPKELVATAWTTDNHNPNMKILMGISHRTKPIHGVQWHPESICSKQGLQIVQNFARLVSDFWQSTPERSTSFLMRKKQELPMNVGKALCRSGRPSASFNGPVGSSNDQKPYSVQSLDLCSDALPEDVFKQLIRDPSNDGEAWLDSSMSRDHHSRYSYLAKSAICLAYFTNAKTVVVYHKHTIVKTISKVDSFWIWLNDVQVLLQKRTTALNADKPSDLESQSKATLQVGFIGQFGYEMARESLPGYNWKALPWLPRFSDRHTACPDAQFMFAKDVFRYDHVQKTWTLYSLTRNGKANPLAAIFGVLDTSSTTEQIEEYGNSLRISMKVLSPTRHPLVTLPTLRGEHTRSSYAAMIAQARSAIKEGDSYELTLTTKFTARLQDQDCFELYRSLRTRNPAPYAAFVNFAATETTIMSSSPERFISIDRYGLVEMKPIKGTVAASKEKQVDDLIKQHLSTDVKELAENLMIVDLIRNDLHNISPAETIKVPKLMEVESYETVHQLVTTIQSKLRPEVGSVEAIGSIFPPGSMTGAPKLRSVRILDRLEHGEKRVVYSGCLGYLCVSGAVDQSVVIRTLVRHGDDLELRAGGAITWLSDPTTEWNEVLTKAEAVTEIDVLGDVGRGREDSMEPGVD